MATTSAQRQAATRSRAAELLSNPQPEAFTQVAKTILVEAIAQAARGENPDNARPIRLAADELVVRLGGTVTVTTPEADTVTAPQTDTVTASQTDTVTKAQAEVERLRERMGQMIGSENAMHKELRELRAHLKNRDAKIEHQKRIAEMTERELRLAGEEIRRLKDSVPSAPATDTVTATEADTVTVQAPLPTDELAQIRAIVAGKSKKKTDVAERYEAIKRAASMYHALNPYQLANMLGTTEPTVRRALKNRPIG